MPDVMLSDGLPETELPAESTEALAALAQALDDPLADRREAVASVVARWPEFMDAWARLGQLARDDVEAYACFRTGYHRGLDRMRKSGWRGSGYLRWTHEPNRGFLRSLEGLRHAAVAIGEAHEAERCSQFLIQLDPAFDGAEAWDAAGA